ncbi:MAG: DNA adenine methylase [Cyanobacteria bacterium P01_E01_bin.42]
MGKLIAFGWYGGKFNHLNWLLPLLPEATHYCEPFGGSAAVLLNRQPASLETYNDLDGEVVNFFQVLREKQEELIQAIALTPFSREEFRLSLEQSSNIPNLERARRFFVRARQVRTGLAQTASEGRWAHCKLTSRAGMAAAVSRWLGSVEGLSEIVQRLLRVQIENDSAMAIIKRYDSKETLFYCDPPYPHDSRSDSKAYGYEMTKEDHQNLADLLHQVSGKVAISGYHSMLMDELYRDWHYVEAPSKKAHSTNTRASKEKRDRVEVLWTNYQIQDNTSQCQTQKKSLTIASKSHQLTLDNLW